MLFTSSHPKRRVALTLAAAVLGFPAAALASPSVIRIDPATHAQTVLASGAPWSTLAGIAVDAAGTIYVANGGWQALDGAGIYSLTAPRFAITPVVAGDGYAAGLVAAGSTLYAFGTPAVRRVGTSAPFAQQVVTSGGLYAESAVDPLFGVLSGSTLYTTTYASCESAEGGPAGVIAVDTATGRQTSIRSFGCAGLQGIALAPDGTLLIAESATSKAAAKIVGLDLTDGSVRTVSSGGLLEDPRGIALTAPGRLVVADWTGAVLAVSTSNGAQSTIASGPRLTGADGLALDARGEIYVTAAGAPPMLKLSAAGRRFSTAGLRFKASCKPRCDAHYEVKVEAKGIYPVSVSDELVGVGAARTVRVRLPKSVNRAISHALARHRSVRMRVTGRPQDSDGVAIGKGASLTVSLTR